MQNHTLVTEIRRWWCVSGCRDKWLCKNKKIKKKKCIRVLNKMWIDEGIFYFSVCFFFSRHCCLMLQGCALDVNKRSKRKGNCHFLRRNFLKYGRCFYVYRMLALNGLLWRHAKPDIFSLYTQISCFQTVVLLLSLYVYTNNLLVV